MLASFHSTQRERNFSLLVSACASNGKLLVHMFAAALYLPSTSRHILHDHCHDEGVWQSRSLPPRWLWRFWLATGAGSACQRRRGCEKYEPVLPSLPKGSSGGCIKEYEINEAAWKRTRPMRLTWSHGQNPKIRNHACPIKSYPKSFPLSLKYMSSLTSGASLLILLLTFVTLTQSNASTDEEDLKEMSI